MRQYRAAEQAQDRLMVLLADRPALKIDKAYLTFLKTGDTTAMHSAIAELPPSLRDEASAVSWRLYVAFKDHDWRQADELIEKMNGSNDEGVFGYGETGRVPVSCDSILIARLQGEQQSSRSAEAREQLHQMVQNSPGDAVLLSRLAIIDALLGNPQHATAEGKRAVEMEPISKDAVNGPGIVINLAAVYAWNGELDLSFETLAPFTKLAFGVHYGDLERDPLWDPLRKDPRFDKLLAELAAKD